MIATKKVIKAKPTIDGDTATATTETRGEESSDSDQTIQLPSSSPTGIAPPPPPQLPPSLTESLLSVQDENTDLVHVKIVQSTLLNQDKEFERRLARLGNNSHDSNTNISNGHDPAPPTAGDEIGHSNPTARVSPVMKRDDSPLYNIPKQSEQIPIDDTTRKSNSVTLSHSSPTMPLSVDHSSGHEAKKLTETVDSRTLVQHTIENQRNNEDDTLHYPSSPPTSSSSLVQSKVLTPSVSSKTALLVRTAACVACVSRSISVSVSLSLERVQASTAIPLH